MLSGRRGHARVLVLTITSRERNAVRAEFGAVNTVDIGRGLACWTADDQSAERLGVVVSQATGRSNMLAEESVKQLIEDWRPEVLVVVGTAGGIARDENDPGPHKGDVVCVEYVHYANYAKYVAGRREQRYFPVQHPDTEILTSEARVLEVGGDWHHDLPQEPPEGDRAPAVQMGELVSVEAVAGDGNAAGQQDLLSGFDHAIAVDMESAGIARAMHTASDSVFYRPTWLAIRGVSDITAADSNAMQLLQALESDNDAERANWTPYAAATAARFAHRLVERLLARERAPFDDPGAEAWVPVLQR